MATDERKGGGGSKDVDDLKARLGLKVPKRAPAIAQPPPVAAPAAPPPPLVAPAELAPQAPSPVYAPEAVQPRTRHTGSHAIYVPPPAYVEEAPPPQKSAWDRFGKALVIAAIVAAAGGTVGYLFGKGAAIKGGYGKVKADAIKIDGVVKAGYAKVEEAAAAIDPAYAHAKKGGKELPPVRPILRQAVDWASVDALAQLEAPKDLESIFETDYKRFNRLTVKYLMSFFLDMSRLVQSAREHAALTKAARVQLESEAKEGSGPRAFGVITQTVPSGPDRGEVVILRGRRNTKLASGETAVVVDVARRSNPAQLLAVPEGAVIHLSAPGLIKTSGSLLEEYNRRNRDLAEIVRRLLEVRPRVTSSIEQIIAQIKG